MDLEDLSLMMQYKHILVIDELYKIEHELIEIYGTFWTKISKWNGDPIIKFYKDLKGDTIPWTLNDHEIAKYSIIQLGEDFEEKINNEDFDSREYYKKIHAYINKS